MKKFAIVFATIILAFSTCLSSGVCAYAYAQGSISEACADTSGPYENGIKESARSAYLVDYDTGTVLYERNADAELPIASMVKIMTLLITFEKIDAGVIDFDTPIVISENAAGMGGSQMFLCAGSTYKAEDLIKGIIVCSANDASVAMAETISGSVDEFVKLMNKTAAQIGMNNTVFVNATGLPAEGQHSTAKDVSKMMLKLLAHEDYFRFSKITLEDYVHPDGRVTQMVNTNKLLRFYKDCDGGKTGFTNAALFCLSATAKRNNMRVIATVVGASDSKARFAEVGSLFNYAFANFECKKIIDSDEHFGGMVEVKKGVHGYVEVKPARDVVLLSKKGDNASYEVKIVPNSDVVAPISVGDVLGVAEVYNEQGNKIGETELVSTAAVAELDFGESLKRVLKNWLIG